MRTVQSVLGFIAPATYSCAGEQVGAKILTLLHLSHLLQQWLQDKVS